MATVVPNPRHIRAFASETAFDTWLVTNHDKQDEVFVRIYKKDSGKATVTHAQALDVTLCWGWIDGIRKSFDETSFLQRR